MAAVKVVMGKVIHDGNHYGVGLVVKGLSKEDCDRIIKMKIGVACSDDALDDEIAEEVKDKKPQYKGNILTEAEKNKIHAESQKEYMGELLSEDDSLEPIKTPSKK